jgi:hypothetical protein
MVSGRAWKDLGGQVLDRSRTQQTAVPPHAPQVAENRKKAENHKNSSIGKAPKMEGDYYLAAHAKKLAAVRTTVQPSLPIVCTYRSPDRSHSHCTGPALSLSGGEERALHIHWTSEPYPRQQLSRYASQRSDQVDAHGVVSKGGTRYGAPKACYTTRRQLPRDIPQKESG